MSGPTAGPGPAPGVPGHIAAMTPKPWTEGRRDYSSNFISCIQLRLNHVGRDWGKEAGKRMGK